MKRLHKIQFGASRPGYGSKFRRGCIDDGPRPKNHMFDPKKFKMGRNQKFIFWGVGGMGEAAKFAAAGHGSSLNGVIDHCR